jgi:hypothetical protein
MADESLDDELRQMAQHRSLKLLKSRRRKPGTGDYGKYGLTDASGTALLGIGEDGLTASPGDITSFLRKEAAGTWKESADTTPDAAPAMPIAASSSDVAQEGRHRKSSSGSRSDRAKPAPEARAAADSDAPAGRTGAPEAAGSKIKPKPEPEPNVKPRLNIRLAKPADTAVLAKLLGQLSGITIGGDAVAINLAAVRKLKGNMVIAEYDQLVGCCAWALMATRPTGVVIFQRRAPMHAARNTDAASPYCRNAAIASAQHACSGDITRREASDPACRPCPWCRRFPRRQSCARAAASTARPRAQ